MPKFVYLLFILVVEVSVGKEMFVVFWIPFCVGICFFNKCNNHCCNGKVPQTRSIQGFLSSLTSLGPFAFSFYFLFFGGPYTYKTYSALVACLLAS